MGKSLEQYHYDQPRKRKCDFCGKLSDKYIELNTQDGNAYFVPFCNEHIAVVKGFAEDFIQGGTIDAGLT